MLVKSKVFVWLTLAIVVVSGISLATGYFRGSSVSLPSLPSSSADLAEVTQETSPPATQVPPSSQDRTTQTVRDISFRLSGVRASANILQVELCIHLPSTENWIPEAGLVVGGQTFPAHGWVLLNSKDAATYISRDRCYRFSFSVPEGARSQAFAAQLVVYKLYTPAPDMPTEEQCARAQQKLQEANTGIKFACRLYPDQGSWGYDILEKPQNMSEDQASLLINQAFIEKTAEGPWKFSVEIPKESQ